MISWLLVLVLFPGFGLIAYLMFGRSFRKKYRVKNKKMEQIKIIIEANTNSNC